MAQQPQIAPSGSFHHKRHQVHTRGRLRTEIITLEEALWLAVGLTFGWFAGKGANILLLLIPIILFVVWLYEQWFASKYGLRFIHNVPVSRRR